MKNHFAINQMKAFLILGDLENKGKSIKDQADYKQKIIFATMKAYIIKWEPPVEWANYTDQERLDILNKLQHNII